jgi:membrane fusion protein, copper/silver efflux system
MTRWRIVGLGAGLILAGAALFWMVSKSAVFSPVGPQQERMADMPRMNMPGMDRRTDPTAPRSGGTGRSDMPAESERAADMITIPPERLQTIGVKYQEVTRRPLDKVIRTVGRVAVDERRLAKVTIKFHGWIERLFVSATGDHVKKGQRLFTIYSPDLVATQEEYLLALQSRKQLGESEITEVAAGSKDLLEATRHRLHLWDIGDEHIRELERTKQVTKTLPIHSPITGTVIHKEVLQGTHVEPGEELYTIADLSHVWILADIYEYELPSIKVGQEATVTLSYDSNTKLNGRIAFIYPTVDPKTRTAVVRFEVGNAEGKLKPEMYTNVELHIPLGVQLALPEGAILDTGTRTVVFVDRGHGTLELRDVRVGAKVEQFYIVESGLMPGERVVASATFLIDSESKLMAATNMMGSLGMAGINMEQARMGQMEMGDMKMSDMKMGETGMPETQSAIRQEKIVDGFTIALSTDPSPPRVGQNRILVQVTDESGQMVPSVNLTLTSAMSMPGMPLTSTPMQQLRKNGLYEAGINLGMAGQWDLTVTVQRQSGPSIRATFSVTPSAGGMSGMQGMEQAERP